MILELAREIAESGARIGEVPYSPKPEIGGARGDGGGREGVE